MRLLLSKQGSIPDWNRSFLYEQGMIHDWSRSFLSEQGMIPDWSGSFLSDQGMLVDWNGSLLYQLENTLQFTEPFANQTRALDRFFVLEQCHYGRLFVALIA